MREKIKSLILVVLCISTVFLLTVNLSLGIEDEQLGNTFGLYGALGSETEGAGTTVRPARIAVGGAGGLYLASGDEADEMWSSVTPILSEALGSVTKISSVTRKEFLDSLNGYSIYTGFTFSVPFHMLQFWWTGEQGLSSGQAASDMALVAEGDRVSLVFCDSSKDEYFRADTAAGYERFTEFCSSYEEANAFFAFQRDGYHMFMPYEPIWSEGVFFPTYSIALPEYFEEGSVSEELISAFGFNPFIAETYLTTKGDIVYVEGYKALSFSSEGKVVYSSNGGAGIPLEVPLRLNGKEAEAQEVSAAADILSRICTAASCHTEFSLAGITEGADGRVFTFERVEGGAMVSEKDGYSAAVTVKDGSITAIRLQLGSYNRISETMLLPVELASALIEGDENRLFVRYCTDDGEALPQLFCRKGE